MTRPIARAKGGMLSSARVAAVSARSIALPCANAASMPSTTPSIRASASAQATSSTVHGRCCASKSATGMPWRME
ncbi:hypothetical protein D3C71_806810 [compost metagenome]